ncbi:MAG TPA: four helix bundle protein [Candidatus Paceibacterota bacterium]|nr:four helix bundle protein [Candidatus Paceibacterota bacterium]
MDTKVPNKPKNDLEERTARFAKNVRAFVRKLPKSIIFIEDGRQVVRSSGSVGANYIEANESLSKKDFVVRAKICRKEAKESRYWLQMFDDLPPGLIGERDKLIQESTELLRIFSAMIAKF